MEEETDMRKKNKGSDTLSVMITAAVITTLAVVAAAASMAYMIHERFRSRRLESENPCHIPCCEPFVPDDEEFEF